MKRVLVTGGAGFVGSHLARALLDRGYAVDVADDLSTGRRENVPEGAELLELDLGAPNALASLPRADYGAILHLAGQSSGERSFDDPERDFDANARSTAALARFALDNGIPALVHASSMGVYGQPEGSPVAEDSPTAPISWYGASKLAAETVLGAAERLGLRTCSLRMFSVYGPGQDLAEMRQGMVSIYLAYLLAGKPVEVKGSLERVRDFVYVDDVVEAWIAALEGEASGPLNVGTGSGTTVGELIELLGSALGVKPEIVEQGGTPGDQRALHADTAAAEAALDWRAQTSLAQGLRRMAAWAGALA